jgi:phosphohistidine phosphatase
VLLDRLSALPADADVVLVGHEPALGVLAGLLLAASPAALPLRKAGACAIAFDGPARRRSGELLWYVPPRLLRALAGRKRL